MKLLDRDGYIRFFLWFLTQVSEDQGSSGFTQKCRVCKTTQRLMIFTISSIIQHSEKYRKEFNIEEVFAGSLFTVYPDGLICRPCFISYQLMPINNAVENLRNGLEERIWDAERNVNIIVEEECE